MNIIYVTVSVKQMMPFSLSPPEVMIRIYFIGIVFHVLPKAVFLTDPQVEFE